MLELRPTCENCNKKLPPNSTEAMICSYECTYCRECVETVLENVCQTCGGGFSPRPIRPKNNLRDNNYLGCDPASVLVKHKPVNIENHQKFVVGIKDKLPHER